tara:strand:- start:380 stop:538 length:159 start_codon:yes stop_codon:yes gene_type:complete
LCEVGKISKIRKISNFYFENSQVNIDIPMFMPHVLNAIIIMGGESLFSLQMA